MNKERVIELLNTRQWPQDFSLDAQKRHLVPADLVAYYLNGQNDSTRLEETEIMQPQYEGIMKRVYQLSQEELIKEIEERRERHWDKKWHDKEEEALHTCSFQWNNEPMSGKARSLYSSVLFKLRKFDGVHV